MISGTVKISRKNACQNQGMSTAPSPQHQLVPRRHDLTLPARDRAGITPQG
jgi:hypothetical protein